MPPRLPPVPPPLPCRQREALATPLDPVEHRALLEQCASLMRPAWALNLASFQHPPQV